MTRVACACETVWTVVPSADQYCIYVVQVVHARCTRTTALRPRTYSIVFVTSATQARAPTADRGPGGGAHYVCSGPTRDGPSLSRSKLTEVRARVSRHSSLYQLEASRRARAPIQAARGASRLELRYGLPPPPLSPKAPLWSNVLPPPCPLRLPPRPPRPSAINTSRGLRGLRSFVIPSRRARRTDTAQLPRLLHTAAGSLALL